MAQEHKTISLAGKDYPVVVPASYTEREDVVDGWKAARTAPKSRRIYAATVGVCVPGLIQGVTLETYDEDLFRYGKACSDALAKVGIGIQEIEKAATVCLHAIQAVRYPTQEAVDKKVDFIVGEEGQI